MSSQATTKNFWKVWSTFQWPEPTPVSFRCYYLDDGTVTLYSMEELPGNYIEVTQKEYVMAQMPAKVIDGKLTVIKPGVVIEKLCPSTAGTTCHSDDICVIQHTGTAWERKKYELN